MVMRNNTIVEFTAGQLAENFSMNEYDKSTSFKETCKIKYGAIGIIKNTYNGIRQSSFFTYRVKIIWNNGQLSTEYVAGNDNFTKLSDKEAMKWLDFINEKENELNYDYEIGDE